MRRGSARPIVVRQSETVECGLACLATMLNFFGHKVGLPTLRERYLISQKGTSLAELVHIASACKLTSRGLQVDLAGLAMVALPAVLHWNDNHFVVLYRIDRRGYTIGDPAAGLKRIPADAFAKRFSGTVLEVAPSADFVPVDERKPPVFRELLGPLRGYARAIAGIFGLALVLEAFSLVGPMYVKTIVDAIVKTADTPLLSVLTLAFLGISALQYVTTYARTWLLSDLSRRISFTSRSVVFSKLVSLPVGYFERRRLGDISSKFHSVEAIQRTVTISFLEGVLDGIMCLATIVMMCYTSRLLGAVAIAVAIVYALLRFIGRHDIEVATENTVSAAASQHSHLLESIRAIKSIRLFRREQARLDSWRALYADQVDFEFASRMLQTRYQVLSRSLLGLSNILLIWYGTLSVLGGQMSVGMLLAFISYRSQFDGRVAALVEKCFELKILRVHFERLGDIMDTRSEFDPSIGKNPGAPARIDDGTVEVTGLVFRHSLTEEPLLDNASFRIASGQSVAFVGPSGAGKTTLLNILMGVYQPDAGKVVIGGLELGAANLAAIREGIGTVLQDDVLLSGTVLENITFFDPEPDTDWALHCARMAAIHADVINMPMAYATLVGELGSVLSGGQKQRILIARALYRKPRILFMDEATSHLDSRNESAVSRAMAGLDITRVLVAHRVETVLSADRILVVDARQVREVGRQEFLGLRDLSRFGLKENAAAVDGMEEPTHA